MSYALFNYLIHILEMGNGHWGCRVMSGNGRMFSSLVKKPPSRIDALNCSRNISNNIIMCYWIHMATQWIIVIINDFWQWNLPVLLDKTADTNLTMDYRASSILCIKCLNIVYLLICIRPYIITIISKNNTYLMGLSRLLVLWNTYQHMLIIKSSLERLIIDIYS